MNMTELFGEVIHSYSRADAIRDGVLVDVSSCKTIFRYPVALSRSVYDLVEKASPRIEEECTDDVEVHDIGAWVWDVCWMAKFPIKKFSESCHLYKVTIGNEAHVLKCHVGPGDDMEPVVTILLPNED